MFRIDNPSAVVTMTAPPPPQTPGFFTDGNPAAGLEATIVDAWWLNQLQEEVISVIAAAGITLNKNSHRQLLDALQTLFTGTGTGPSGNFLPLTGGRLYQAGASNILTMDSDHGQATGILMQNGGQHQWLIGQGLEGNFRIFDNSTASTCLRIDQLSHDVEIVGNNLSLGNAATEQWITRPNATQGIIMGRRGGGNIAYLSVAANDIWLSFGTVHTGDLRNTNFWTNAIRAINPGGLSFIDTCQFAGDVHVGGTLFGVNGSFTNSVSTTGAFWWPGGGVSAGVLTATNLIATNAIWAGGATARNNAISGVDLFADGNLYVDSIRALPGSSWVSVHNHLQAGGMLSVLSHVTVAGNVTCANIQTTANVYIALDGTVDGNVYAGNNVSGATLTARNSLTVAGDAYVDNDVNAANNIYVGAHLNAANVTARSMLTVAHINPYGGTTTHAYGHFSQHNGGCMYKDMHHVNTWVAYDGGNFHINHDLYAANFSGSSDERRKQNIHEHPLNALPAVRGVKLYDFDRIDRRGTVVGHDDLGFSAQQVRLTMPEAVIETPEMLFDEEPAPEYPGGPCVIQTGEPTLSISVFPMLAYLVGAVQELADKVDQLEARGA